MEVLWSVNNIPLDLFTWNSSNLERAPLTSHIIIILCVCVFVDDQLLLRYIKSVTQLVCQSNGPIIVIVKVRIGFWPNNIELEQFSDFPIFRFSSIANTMTITTIDSLHFITITNTCTLILKWLQIGNRE